MRLRKYELGLDYPELCEWWRRNKFPPPPTASMPVNGVVVEDEKWKYAACFWYIVEGPWAWIDYVVANPDAPLKAKVKAIQLVIETAKKDIIAVKTACGFEHPLIITLLENEGLIKLFQKTGFRVGDKEMTTLVFGGLK